MCEIKSVWFSWDQSITCISANTLFQRKVYGSPWSLRPQIKEMEDELSNDKKNTIDKTNSFNQCVCV